MSPVGLQRLPAAALVFLGLAPVLTGLPMRPDPSFPREALACLAAGLLLLALALRRGGWRPPGVRVPGLVPALLAGLILLLATLPALGEGAASAAASLLLALALLWAASRQRDPAGLLQPLAWGLLIGSLASVAVLLHQFLLPCAADGLLIAQAPPGRPYGNLRQPNLMASYLLLGLLAGVLLAARRPVAPSGAGLLAGSLLLVLGLALTASRTGLLALLLPAAWGLFDPRLPRRLRGLLLSLPLQYLLAFGLLALAPPPALPADAPAACRAAAEGRPAASASAEEEAPEPPAPTYRGLRRLQAGGDLSSGRLAIWQDSWTLAARHPWTGVGWGRLNLAWFFEEGMVRRVGVLTHAHSLPLQLAVELGWPRALAVLGLLGLSLWGVARAARRGLPATAAGLMLGVLLLHSLLEYPLWHAFFLLPFAALLGFALAPDEAPGPAPGADPPPAGLSRLGCGLAGGLALLGLGLAVPQHRQIEALLRLPPAQRVEAARALRAQGSLYPHHLSRLELTARGARPAPEAFGPALASGLNPALLRAYALALQRSGQEPAARFVAQRLRQFRDPAVQAQFQDCDLPDPPAAFRCQREPVVLDWRTLPGLRP